MVKLDGNSSLAASRRRMRTQAEWNVDTHIRSATGPTRAATRCFISAAALLVKVMARIENGEAPSSPMSQATRCVSTGVLPEPAPATTSIGPPGWVTASCCTGLSPARRSAVGTVGATAIQPYREGVTPKRDLDDRQAVAKTLRTGR